MSIHEMRKSYSMAGLAKRDVDADPMVQFQRWFEEAQQPDLPDWMEVNAMTLATADTEGKVTSRIVLLKGIEGGRLCFYTNYESEKGKQIAENPHVSLCFLWGHLQRQVRIQGIARKSDRSKSVHYFHSRPRESQLGAHVSRQSSVIDSGRVLEEQFTALESKYDQQEIPCPDHWGGYEVQPTTFEFWQGRPGRLHDRICYRWDAEQWQLLRLSP
ncbi:MAG: pyridoxamine 5'-phosphate oxidase [Rubripirellula sp.]|nr:pyridoxamine 5'-phosphate oxidase [Rhodopirellula sp.]MCH1440086.1 pyridoxamine 5'-phosphate oxidase [Rubripirellula sp.]OUX08632.1 MAG: pyridoxamine 5'-phosphate oxidase [Planctomycetaceae bacterium TMED240]